MSNYHKIITEFCCDDVSICKYVEMDGCLRCKRFLPMGVLLLDLDRDGADRQELIVDFMEALDNE